MANPVEEMLLRQLNVNPTGIERWILLGILRSGNFYRMVRNKLCPRQTDGRLRQDFITPRYNALYKVADQYWRLLDRASLAQDMDAPRHLLETLLQDDLELGRLDAEEHALLIEEFDKFFYPTPKVAPEMLQALQGPLKVWLDMRMATMAVNAAHLDGQTRRLSIRNLDETISSYRRAASMEESKVVKPGAMLDGRKVFYRRVSTGLDDLDEKMGGGFGRGEAALVAGANGAGKTVLGCQFTVEFAKQGLNVGYFSTEQTPLDLTYRMLSNYSGVEFKHFTNRAEMRELSRAEAVELENLPALFQTDPDALAGLEGFRLNVVPRVEFMDWSGGAAPIVQDAFDPAMDAMAQSLGAPLDVVIFDWIGGAMERGKDKEHLRHYYYDAVNYLVNYAKSHPRLAIIIMAQIDKAKAEGKPFIKMTHLAECKAMSDNVSTFIGISSVTDKKPDSEGMMMEDPRALQVLNVDKARYGPKGGVKVLRMFARQKFGQVERR